MLCQAEFDAQYGGVLCEGCLNGETPKKTKKIARAVAISAQEEEAEVLVRNIFVDEL